ncbi:hypothetical protein GLAREA_07397 [Glarea lozoyensis ATCC 20868]|uniref:Uncharacterized protein n=2 Tax=Glarea lozoyensis TaxID=101852 RepID=S3D5A5_GLAL2|nr:uncharacterized protein GLAREA_07397 [Glarea lozoyensis ATCC 20868]EHK97062.1 hypothetical protein M7I_7203 [Glarea lozoyensis 74030]EPE32264.1 hypothetical protein GLAREA_07397 [Glarea lozoyensis ATCC 20868]
MPEQSKGNSSSKKPRTHHWFGSKSKVSANIDSKNDTASPRQRRRNSDPLPTSANESTLEENTQPIRRSKTELFKQKAPKYAFVALKLGLVIGTLVAQLA